MKSFLQASAVKTESEIKALKDEVSESMRTMKTELEASILTLDVTLNNACGDSAQTQKGNMAIIKEL